jgi:hypothetical protein
MQRTPSRFGQGLGGGALMAVWLVGAQAAGAGQPLHTGPDGRPRIDLVWFDPLNVARPAADGIGREVALIFDDLGVATTWTAGAMGSYTAPPQVNVVFLAALPSSALPAATMGVVTSARESRTVWVVVPNVVRVLGGAQGSAPGGRLEDAILARALGRVVAHEIVHLAAPRLAHAAEGLMQASLGRRDLGMGRLRLDLASRRAVLPGLARLADPAFVLAPLTIAG